VASRETTLTTVVTDGLNELCRGDGGNGYQAKRGSGGDRGQTHRRRQNEGEETVQTRLIPLTDVLGRCWTGGVRPVYRPV